MWETKQLEELEQSEHEEVLAALALMVKDITDANDAVAAEITNFYRKYGKDGVVTYSEARKYVSSKQRKRRLYVLLEALQAEIDNLEIELSGKISDLLSKLESLDADFFGEELSLPDDLSWGEDELTWKERLSDNCNKWLVAISVELKQAFVRGRKLENTISQINRRFNTINNVVERLVETESVALTSEAKRKSFKEFGIDKYQFLAIGDDRTCEICGALDGKIFPMSQFEIGVTASPIHPRCRCTCVPVIS